MNVITNFQIVTWAAVQRGDVKEGTWCGRNRQLVPSGIRASKSSHELTEITLLKCLYKFIYAVHNRQILTAGFSSPYTQYWRWFLYQRGNSDHVFHVSASTFYLISNSEIYEYVVLYPICICKLIYLDIKKNIEGIYENVWTEFVFTFA